MGRNATLARIASAKTSGNNNRFKDGIYLCVVLGVTLTNKKAGDCFIPELQVLTAEAVEDAYYDPTGAKAVWGNAPGAKIMPPNKPGTTVGCVWIMTQDSAPGNAKMFTLRLWGEDVDAFSAKEEEANLKGEDGPISEALAYVIGAEQPSRGMLVRANVLRSPKKDKEPFVGPTWIPVRQSAAGIARRRTLLDRGVLQAPTAAEDAAEALECEEEDRKEEARVAAEAAGATKAA